MCDNCKDLIAALLARRHLEDIVSCKKLFYIGGYAFLGRKMSVDGDCFVYVNVFTRYSFSTTDKDAKQKYEKIK